MSRYGYYLSDIGNFDELADWLESHINETLDRLGVPKNQRPPQMLNVIKGLMEDSLHEEIEKYGWSGDEELFGLIAVNMFHKAFAGYNENLYLEWFDMNYEELEEENPNPYTSKSPKQARAELEKMYKLEGAEFTEADNIEFMKRGVQGNLLKIQKHLLMSIKDGTNITSIKTDSGQDLSKISNELNELLGKIDKFDTDARQIMMKMQWIG